MPVATSPYRTQREPPFAKLIRGSWFAKVVVMSERSTEQIRELLDCLYQFAIVSRNEGLLLPLWLACVILHGHTYPWDQVPQFSS
jgi:hypothetical protein